MKLFSKLASDDLLKVALAVVLIGLGSGLFSFLMHELVFNFSNYIGTLQKYSYKTFFIGTGLALLSFLLTKYIFQDTNGSGIPQVKLGLVAHKGKMPKRMPFGKFVTAFLTLCSGLSFGKEGPLVTISASWAHLISYLLKLNRQITKILVSAGAAAGLAAAFNAPIAAVVFTIEEILGELNTKYLGPIIVTSVIASVTSYKLLGNKSTFISLNYGFNEEWHLIFYLLLGGIMSFIGIVFVKLIIFFKDIKKKYFLKNDFVFIIISVLAVAIFSQFSETVTGDGTSTINRLLRGDHEIVLSTILIVFIMKLILSATSYSTGLSGGLFMPVLFLGAIGGSVFALVLIKLGWQNIEIGAFALLGMTSLLVAVIRAPFTAFVMLFEMTRDYELILPLMISSITAYWVSSKLNPESVYETVAEYEGVYLPTSRDNECLTDMSVEECMIKSVITLDHDRTIEEEKSLFIDNHFGGYPVLKNNKLVGVVTASRLKKTLGAEPHKKINEISKFSVISIFPDQSLLLALDKMKRFDIGCLPVVSRFNDKKIMGIITPEDVINYLGISKEEP